jgi:GntR family transcriptional regulator
MSWQATAWAVEQRTGHPTCKIILLVLSETADREGFTFQKISTIADKCEVSADTVRRGLAKLVEGGFLRVAPRYRPDGSQTSNGYRLLLPGINHAAGPDCDAPDDGTPPSNLRGGGGTDASPPPSTGATPITTSPNHHDSLSSSATPQKKGAPAASKGVRPSKWTDKPIDERRGVDGIPVTQEGDPDWKAMVWEIQLPLLVAMAQKTTGKPVSMGSARGRIGKLIKARTPHEVAQMIGQVLRSEPGGCPFDYLEGVKRGANTEEAMAHKAMFAPIDY